MADFFADNMVKRIIGEIIINKGKLPSNEIVWKSITRRMFLNFSPIQVSKWFYECLEEASDEQWFEHKYPKDFFNENWEYKDPKKRTVIKVNPRRKLIKDNLKIIEVAADYGLKIKKNKTQCQFHEDEDPSLTFYPITNTFHCFGCHKSGDVIEFVRRMENVREKKSYKKRS